MGPLISGEGWGSRGLLELGECEVGVFEGFLALFCVSVYGAS